MSIKVIGPNTSLSHNIYPVTPVQFIKLPEMYPFVMESRPLTLFSSAFLKQVSKTSFRVQELHATHMPCSLL